MKIGKCSQCGNYMYSGECCLYCGNTDVNNEIVLPPINEKVVELISETENLVKTRKFDEAIRLSNIILEWPPNFARIFWLRLLAKKKCSSALELLGKGFDCENDADFCNAIKYSMGEEKSIYSDLRIKVNAFREMIKKEIIDHEMECKLRTDILAINRDMEKEVNKRKEKLFSLWSDLEATEYSLYALEMDFKWLSKEYIEALDKSEQAASFIKTETYKMEECTEINLHKYQIRIGNAMQQSEEAKAAIDNMKRTHPWVDEYKTLLAKRDEQARCLAKELSSVRDYRKSINHTISEIDDIEDNHRKAFHMADMYNFQYAFKLLGKNQFNQVFHNLGIRQEIFVENIDEFSQEENVQSKFTKTIFGVQVEVPKKANDLTDENTTWGASNDVY